MSEACVRKRVGGFSMIEVLVALLIVSFALLGMAGLITRSTVIEVESLQRSQALLLAREMAERIELNRADALSGRYGQAAALTAQVADCGGAASRVDRDLCEWRGLLAGSNETQDGAASSALNGARGCVTLVPGTTSSYVVTVAWRGLAPAGAPADACGLLDGEDPALLRTVTRLVELGRLDG